MGRLSHAQHAESASRGTTRQPTFANRRDSEANIADSGRNSLTMAIGYSRHKWEMPVGESLPPDVARFEPLGHPLHYRGQASEGFGTGYYEFCGLSDGFFVHINDVAHASPCHLSVSAPDILRVRLASADDFDFRLSNESDARLRVKGPAVTVIIEPRGQPAGEAVIDGHTTVVSIYIHRSTLKRLYADREHELPPVVRAFIAGTLDRTVAQPLPLGPTFLRCLEDLTNCELESHGRRLFFRSKAVEILCHTFRQLGQEQSRISPSISVTTRRGVLKAQHLLNGNFAMPPSLDDLSQAVGLSRTVLSAGFRQIIGRTVFEYIEELRMQHALTLLTRQDSSITQIAYEVGYSHASSFSKAVLRRYGSTPRQILRRGVTEISTKR